MGQVAQLLVKGRLPSLNDLIFAGVRKRIHLQREATNRVKLLAQHARLPRFERAFLRFIWYEPNDNRDPDGVAGGGRKLILDGLVQAGVLPNDKRKHVAGWIDDFPEVSGTDHEVLVFIEAAT